MNSNHHPQRSAQQEEVAGRQGDSVRSKAASPLRIPLRMRKAHGFSANTDPLSTTSGGVTAAPNTGQIPKIVEQTKGRRRGKRRSLSRGGWLPDQHGAYAMVLIPFWIGVFNSQFVPAQILLFALWVVGYFAFFALGKWFRAARKERFVPAVQTYAGITLVLGILNVLLMPQLFEWALVFLPLILLSTWQSFAKKDRTLWGRLVTILASGLISLVSYDVGTGFKRGFSPIPWLEHPISKAQSWGVSPTGQVQGWTWAGLVALGIILYYWSTVPYVRSLVREKGSPKFWYFSIANHLAILVFVLVEAVCGWVTISHLLVWTVLAFRSWALPCYATKHPGKVKVKMIGQAEIPVSLIVFATLLFF